MVYLITCTVEVYIGRRAETYSHEYMAVAATKEDAKKYVAESADSKCTWTWEEHNGTSMCFGKQIDGRTSEMYYVIRPIEEYRPYK